MAVSPQHRKKSISEVEPTTRRNFLRRTAKTAVRVGATATVLGVLFKGLRESAAPEENTARELGILRPPGALAEKEFLGVCIRCDRCRDACEARAIRIFPPTKGKLAGTPYIHAQDSGCTLCLKCGQACPTGALMELDEQTQANMGTAVVDKRLCVSWNGTGACGACHTICPLKNRAIKQELFNRPVVGVEQCVGCGLCEEACIVKDRKAIRVFSGRAWT